MKLYMTADSDTGTGKTTRGGHRRLTVRCLADLRTGRATVATVQIYVDRDGQIVVEMAHRDGEIEREIYT